MKVRTKDGRELVMYPAGNTYGIRIHSVELDGRDVREILRKVNSIKGDDFTEKQLLFLLDYLDALAYRMDM